MKEYKDRAIVFIIALIVLIASALVNHYGGEETDVPTSVGGAVVDIDYGEVSDYALGTEVKQQAVNELSVEIKEGEHKGEVVTALEYRDDIVPIQPKEVEVGNRVLVRYDEYNESWDFIDYDRRFIVYGLIFLFLILLLIFGGKKGFYTIVTLALTMGMVIFVFLPGILRGRNIYALAIFVAIYIILTTLLLLDGMTKKSFAAILGNIAGVLVAGLLAFVANRLLFMTGAIDENSIYLAMSLEDGSLNLLAVLWSGVVIGALGAIMDVSMTVASAISEVAEAGKNLDGFHLWKSGLAVGRDAMGTMTNTLILAYVGSYLSVALLLLAHNQDYRWIMSMEMMVAEFVQAIAGSIGILVTVPMTAGISSILWRNIQKPWKEETGEHGE